MRRHPKRITPPHYLTPYELDLLTRAAALPVLQWDRLRDRDGRPLDVLQRSGYAHVTIAGVTATAEGRALLERAR